LPLLSAAVESHAKDLKSLK